MIFTASPVKALLFLLFIAVLQQLEGNLIYPRVVGASIGLPGVWVLAAVTIGGGVLGVGGMLLAVPLAAAAYQMLREDVRPQKLASGRAAGNRTIRMTQPPLFGRLGLILSGKEPMEKPCDETRHTVL